MQRKHNRNRHPKQVKQNHNRTTAFERSVINYLGRKLIFDWRDQPQVVSYNRISGLIILFRFRQLSGHLLEKAAH